MKRAVAVLLLMVFAAGLGGALEYALGLGGRLGAWFQNDTETALDHATKHLDPNYLCPMHPQIVRNEPGECPICGMDLVAVQSETKASPVGLPEVTISPEVVQNLGVRVAPVKKRTLWRRIDTVGYVEYDRTKLRHIYAPAEGTIERLAISSEGERIKQGQFLFQVFSPMLSSSDDETYADRNGIVADLNVIEGSYIDVTTRVMTYGDLSSVWVLAEVFENQASWVRIGKSAEVRIPSFPDRVWEGTVDYIYPNLDPETRTLKVRLRYANPDEALKPNMHAEVTIYGGGKPNTLTVPREALIRTGTQDRVVLALGEGRFHPRKVQAGIERGDWVEILEGLQEGDQVVISAQFLIDSEASLKASLLRMQTSKPAAGH